VTVAHIKVNKKGQEVVKRERERERERERDIFWPSRKQSAD